MKNVIAIVFMRCCRLAVVGLAVAVSSVAADDSVRVEKLTQVFEHSGIGAHFSWISTTVLDESQIAWEACEQANNQTTIGPKLSEMLAGDTLKSNFIDELDNRLSPTQLDQIVGWIESEAGTNIHKAEADSIDFDEASMESKIAEFQESGQYTEARIVKLRRMLADTGAVYFLSALNTELSAMVAMASVCSNSDSAIADADAQIKDDRSSETLYRSFMRQGLVLPSGVIYHHISDADFDAYSAFANSDAGKAYFTALIQGVRALLAGKVDNLRDMVTSTTPSD